MPVRHRGCDWATFTVAHQIRGRFVPVRAESLKQSREGLKVAVAENFYPGVPVDEGAIDTPQHWMTEGKTKL